MMIDEVVELRDGLSCSSSFLRQEFCDMVRLRDLMGLSGVQGV